MAQNGDLRDHFLPRGNPRFAAAESQSDAGWARARAFEEVSVETEELAADQAAKVRGWAYGHRARWTAA